MIRGTLKQFCLSGVMMILLLAAAPISASVITMDYDFSQPVLTEMDGVFFVSMEGCESFADPGQPILPAHPVRLLLPPGESIREIEIVPGERIQLDGRYLLAAGQPQAPLSFMGPFAPFPAEPTIYNSDQPFPAALLGDAIVGHYRGHTIANFALYPVEYRAASGQLSYLSSCEVRIHTQMDDGAGLRHFRGDGLTGARVENLVDNPADISLYAGLTASGGGTRDLDPNDKTRYLIITTDTWDAYLGDFADFQTQRGLKADIYLRDWIEANYSGQDSQDRIRNFIIDAYATWDLQYVLLVGDASSSTGIPHRGLYASAYGTTDSNIPGDLYYGCLDGNWNDDSDSRWGEVGEADLYHEVGVGRFAISNPGELENAILKAVRYQTAPVMSESAEALQAGELLWSSPLTWGGTYLDQILNSSSANGYSTVGFDASNMNCGTLYDRDGTWSYSTLINMMNNGLNIVNHLGHCDTDYMMKFYISNIGSFTNDGINHSYNFIYSQGCFPGAFDSNCISEQLHCDEHGAVALVTNSRYGWGDPGGTNGSSQFFDREFFDAMFAEDIYAVSDVNDDSKMDVIWNLSYGANRWCFYELNLFGDPAMHLWTGTPGTLNVNLPDVLFVGAPDMEVTVFALGGGPVANARVAVYSDDYSVYDVGETNAFGVVTLHPETADPGDLNVKVIAHDFLAWGGSVSVVPPSGPYLTFESVTIEDEAGDGDGALDEGEEPGLAITLENVGTETATGVSATLVCSDEYITILDDTRSFPDIPAGNFGISAEPFLIAVAGDVPEGHLVQFNLSIDSDQGSWDGSFFESAQAPIVAALGTSVDDVANGNGDGGADPDETVLVRVLLGNTGSSAAEDLSGVITCSDANVVIHDDFGECDVVQVDDTDALIGVFRIELLPDCPSPGNISFDLELESDNGYAVSLSFDLAVGGWLDDMEVDRDWTVGGAGDDATTGIWERVDPIGTSYNGHTIQPENDHTAAPGTHCYVTGNGSAGGSAGENDVDGGSTTLLSPVFNVEGAQSVTASYWRWYTNSWGNSPDSDYWDVEVTDDGSTWVSLEHTTTTNASWVEMNFDIGDYVDFTDYLQFRFIARDEGDASLVEAAIDDFYLDVWLPPTTAVDDGAAAGPRPMLACYPNPFNPKTTIAYQVVGKGDVTLSVFDVRGRNVRTLAEGVQEAGEYNVVFDGRDDGGRSLASGLYFVRMETPGQRVSRKVMLLK